MNEEENQIETQNDRQDSIEISRTAKGTYSWRIKRYYDFSKTEPDDVLIQIAKIDAKLKREYGGETNE